jgi:hypothetical protein
MGGERLHHVAGIAVEVAQFGVSGAVGEDPEPHRSRRLSVLGLRSSSPSPGHWIR